MMINKPDPSPRARWVVPSLSVLMLAACSVLDYPDEPAYQRAHQTRALELPPDLSAPNSGAVPEIVAAEATAGDLEGFQQFKQFEQWEEFEQYKAWKAQAAQSEQLDFQAFLEARRAMRSGENEGAGVSIDTNFDQSRDIRIAQIDAESAWQVLDIALGALGVEIVGRRPDSFAIDVALPELQESSVFRPRADRFTLKLGRDQKDMLIALVDRNGKRVAGQPAAQFMERLAGQTRIAKVRLELENRVTEVRAKPGTLRDTASGHVELDLPDDPERAWSQLDYVIDQIGFTVLDRNRDDRTFTIRYITDDQIKPERTGLARLAFWKRDESIPESRMTYTVRVEDAGSGSSTVRVVDGNSQESDTGDRILELLRDQL